MNSEILVYILKRILLMIPTLLGVLTLTFRAVNVGAKR
jgi:microcin C transport system permease protein